MVCMFTLFTPFRPRPHGAETGENFPVLFYAVQEYLRKDGVIVKPYRAVETL